MVKVADDDPESIQKAANVFVHHFYHDFLYSFKKIGRFYKDRVIFRPQYGHFLQIFTIKEMQGIMSPEKYSEVKIEPEDIRAESHELGVEIVVHVAGQLIGKDKTVQSFTQIFLLEQHKGKKWVYSAVYDEFIYTHGKNEESVSYVDVDDDHEFVYPGGFCYGNYYTEEEMVGRFQLLKQSSVVDLHLCFGIYGDGDDDREDVDADGYRGSADDSDVLMYKEPDFATSERIFDTDEADLGDPRDGSVIDAEPGLALSASGGKVASSINAEKKGYPKRPRDEGESQKESQNVLGKQSLQADDGITSASDLVSSKWEAEKGSVSAQNKLKSKKKHSKGSPRRPGSGDDSRNKSKKWLTKLLEAGDGKKLGSTSSSSGIEDEFPAVGLEKRKIKKADQVPFSPEKPQLKGGSGNQNQNMLPEVRTLDLHGQTNCEEAKRLTINFLQKFSLRPSDVIVTVIPGRGEHSKDKIPVLQPMVLELLEDLKLNNYKLCNKGGAVDITIKQGWSFSLSGYKNQKSVSISDIVDSSYKSKGASSSNAQVSSWAEKYVIMATDNDGYVAIIEDFARKIRCREKDVISLPMDNNIFQQENAEFFYVFGKDLIDFCNMKTVDVTLISAYMRFLFAKYKKSCKIITFLDPSSTSPNLLLGISEGLEKTKKKKKNQLLFIPYNIQPMAHWVLMVIDCSKMLVYWVDSLHTEPGELTKLSVNEGLNPMLTADTLRPIWRIIKGPKQPDSVQCGYYVIKFMRELIDEPSQSIEAKMEKLAGKETYTPEEINVVRAEFSNYIIVLGNMS